MVKSTIWVLVPLLLSILLQTSCIREGLSECEEEYFITIKVVDVSTGNDITSSEDVNHVDLFLFNQNEHFVRMISIDSTVIRQKSPIPITSDYDDIYWISAWGNLSDDQYVSKPDPSSTLEDLTVSVLAEEDQGYSRTMGDLFFGIKQVDNSPGARIRNEEIIISRKNARMYITVRGLPEPYNATDYYFTIDLNDNGYNFKGVPVPNAIKIRQNGIILVNRDFVSPSSFNLIHTNSAKEDYVTIHLYKRSNGNQDGEDQMIASVNSDSNGNPIVLLAGQTTNLLIDLRREVSVYVKTSPWDKTEQWVEW